MFEGSTIFGEQLKGIEAVLPLDQLKFDMAFMDAEDRDDFLKIEKFYDLIAYKMSFTQAYDTVIVSGDEAALFALEHRQKLFNKAPLIFMGIEDYDIVQTYRQEEATYFIEGDNYHEETINLAMGLIPKADKIYAIFDRSARAQKNKI